MSRGHARKFGPEQKGWWWTLLALIVALIVAFGDGADAHTADERAVWEADWSARVADRGMTATLIGEWVDFQHRHPDPPDPLPVTAFTYRGVGDRAADVERWRPLVAGTFPAAEVNRALCVIAWESGGNPDAKNPRSSAMGLFQIMASIWVPHFGLGDPTVLYSANVNVHYAHLIWQSQGWGAWQAVNRGRC